MILTLNDMQSKLDSLIESLSNVLIGFVVAVASQVVIFPFFGINIPLADNILLGVYFTAISIVRSYLVRRYFNEKR